MSVVIDPLVIVLEPPNNEVLSKVEGIFTHFVPSQPSIVNVVKLLLVSVLILLVAFHVKEIFAAVPPLISQYSTLSTDLIPMPNDAVLKGPPVGNTGSVPPLKLLVFAVLAFTP